MNKLGVWVSPFTIWNMRISYTQLRSSPLAIKNLHRCKLTFQKISASRTCENMCVKAVLKYIFEMTVIFGAPSAYSYGFVLCF
jgi:hypothetical protein